MQTAAAYLAYDLIEKQLATALDCDRLEMEAIALRAVKRVPDWSHTWHEVHGAKNLRTPHELRHHTIEIPIAIGLNVLAPDDIGINHWDRPTSVYRLIVNGVDIQELEVRFHRDRQRERLAR